MIWRIGPVWWAVVLLAMPATTIAIAMLLGDSVRPLSVAAIGAELGGVMVGFFLVNLWEEIAWAGFLQTRLEERHHLYVAAALTAIPFAAIHMPLQVINGNTAPVDLAVAFAVLAAFGVVFRSMEGLVLRGTGSLLAVGVMHTLFNRSNNTDGIVAKLLVGTHRQIGALVATLVVTVVLAIVLRDRVRSRREPAIA